MSLTKSELGNIIRILLLILSWYIVSSANGIFGKMILREFSHPLTVTLAQLLSISIYTRSFLSYLSVRPFSVSRLYYIKSILPLAFLKFTSSVLSHVSIWKVPVSYVHTVKATMPLFTVALSRFYSREKVSWKIYGSLLPIVFGVLLSSLYELSFDALGLTSALFSTAGFSFMNISSKGVLKETNCHPLRLLLVLSQWALGLLLPFWMSFDGLEALRALSVTESKVWLWLLMDGALNALQNVFAFTLLKLVHPLTYSVVNVSKRIAVIVVSLIFLQNSVSGLNIAGMILAISGVLLYHKVKYEEKKTGTILPFNKDSYSSSASYPFSTSSNSSLWNSATTFHSVKLSL